MGERSCPEICYSIKLCSFRLPQKKPLSFLLNNFAHTRLLCGFDNDKLATGSRRWRGKRVGHGGNFNVIAACSQSQKHRWEFPPRCWHIRGVHPRHHPWAHRISNVSLYNRAYTAACGCCEDGLIRVSSLSLHLGPDAWRTGDWRHTVAVCALSYLKWLKDEEAKVKVIKSLGVEKRNCFILEFQFWNHKKKNNLKRKRTRASVLQVQSKGEKEKWCTTRGTLLLTATAIYLSTHNYQKEKEEKVSWGSVPVKLYARWLKLEIFIQMCVCVHL